MFHDLGLSLVIRWLLFAVTLVLLPFLTIGTIRKVKARLQNRIGAPILQSLFDLLKLVRKGETVSETVSWLFRGNAAIGLANVLLISVLVPWVVFKPACPGADFILMIYLFALGRMFAILAAMDAGSAFGAFGASREATLSMLVEPATILSLGAVAMLARTSDLNIVFSFVQKALADQPGVWLLVGSAISISSLVELSRMPVDDPTTHLELTMVHEAMILEYSGRNLALVEFTHALRMTVLFGLTAQCYLHAIPFVWRMNVLGQGIADVLMILVLAVCVGVFEGLAVKLRWRKVPEFIAYSITMSLLACLVTVAQGVIR
jgi:formate hydrogenlyase subunit 4